MGDTLLIPEVLKLIHNAESRKERVRLLVTHKSEALLAILRGTHDPEIAWDGLPDAEPVWRADTAPEGISPSSLFLESKKFAYFVKNMTPDVAKFTREKIFVDILESVHPTEAQLVLDMVFKRKQTADGLTPKLILEAFPGLFPLTKKE